MDAAAPGWYPHPDRPGIHWWDGQRWVDPPTAPATAARPAPYTPTYPTYPTYPTGTPYAPPPRPAPYAGRLRTPARTGNSYAITAMIVSAIYVCLALVVGVVLLGIVPVLMTVRSFTARERLAPAALLAAVVAVGVAFAMYRR